MSDVLLSPLLQLFASRPPLPGQAQLGLQQSQNRVANPWVPEVGGQVPGEPLEVLELEDAVVELDEAAVELEEAVVVELLDEEVPPVHCPFAQVMLVAQTCPQ
jgi:hypothetical protein